MGKNFKNIFEKVQFLTNLHAENLIFPFLNLLDKTQKVTKIFVLAPLFLFIYSS